MSVAFRLCVEWCRREKGASPVFGLAPDKHTSMGSPPSGYRLPVPLVTELTWRLRPPEMTLWSGTLLLPLDAAPGLSAAALDLTEDHMVGLMISRVADGWFERRFALDLRDRLRPQGFHVTAFINLAHVYVKLSPRMALPKMRRGLPVDPTLWNGPGAVREGQRTVDAIRRLLAATPGHGRAAYPADKYPSSRPWQQLPWPAHQG